MQRSFKDQLKQWKKDHLEVKEQRKSKPVKRKPSVKKQDKISDGDLAFLMGSNMKTLRRGKGGAYK